MQRKYKEETKRLKKLRVSMNKENLQATAVGVLVAKQITNGERLDIKKAMDRVGVSIPQERILEASEFKDVLEVHKEEINSLLELSFKYAKEKAGEGSFRDHIVAIDTLTKTRRLLEDKSTANVAIGQVLDELEYD